MVQPLRDSDVLVVDCQSTGANPQRGHLLELGWGIANPSREGALPAGPVEAHILALPAGETIPRRIARLTGLEEEQLEKALPPELVWQWLTRTAGEMASCSGIERALTVIHFARFERPFLRDLHERVSPGGAFPLDIVCTHQIARRLLPELPRRGLRALAGYFGFSPNQLRRCTGHVRATAAVWESLVALLEERCGITTAEDLASWLAAAPAPPAAKRVFPMAREKRLALPDRPGVYRMLRSNGDILYVGKATSLKNRVNSYFQKQTGVSDRLLEMLTQARDLAVTVTETSLEAALLENDEIKRHAPPYNLALQDGGREICFYTPDFLEAGTVPSAAFCRGPLPSREALGPFAELCTLLGRGNGVAQATVQAAPGEALGLDSVSAAELEAGCLLAGIEQFRQKYFQGTGGSLPRRPLARRLLRLGGGLWRQRLEELESAPDEPEAGSGADTEDPLEEEEEPLWTPERVAGLLEGIVRRAAFQTRRAQWFCLLSESILIWEEPGGPVAPARSLVFRGGRPEEKGSRVLEDGGEWIPAGNIVPLLERQKSFDRAAYDRMRVLTTELKRLVKESERVEVRVGCHRSWKRETLSAMLRWV